MGFRPPNLPAPGTDLFCVGRGAAHQAGTLLPTFAARRLEEDTLRILEQS